jgi:hypothetical protein
MSKNKVYFPKDERFNLFCISSSSTGLVIPLAPFGYPDIHLTIYIKDMENKIGFRKLSIHLSNHQTGKIVKECCLEFNEELLNQQYSEKFKQFSDRYLSILQRYIVEEKNLQNKKLVCYDCFNKQFSQYKLHKKELAKQSYKQMIKDLKNIPKYKSEPCFDSKHRLLIDLKTGKIYMKGTVGVLKYSSTSKMLKELDSVFKEVFPEEISWFDKLFKDFKKVLKEYKVK